MKDKQLNPLNKERLRTERPEIDLFGLIFYKTVNLASKDQNANKADDKEATD